MARPTSWFFTTQVVHVNNLTYLLKDVVCVIDNILLTYAAILKMAYKLFYGSRLGVLSCVVTFYQGSLNQTLWGFQNRSSKSLNSLHKVGSDFLPERRYSVV